MFGAHRVRLLGVHHKHAQHKEASGQHSQRIQRVHNDVGDENVAACVRVLLGSRRRGSGDLLRCTAIFFVPTTRRRPIPR